MPISSYIARIHRALAALTLALAASAIPLTAAPRGPMPDTVFLSIIDRRDSTQQRAIPLPPLQALIQAKVPTRVVVEPRDPFSYETDSGTLALQFFVTDQSLTFSTGNRNQWHASVLGMIRLVDARGGTPVTAVIPINESGMHTNWKGPSSGRDAMEEALTKAITTIARVVADSAIVKTAPLVLRASPAEYEPFFATGTATVAGQAFLLTRGGDSKRAAGRDVTLDLYTPITSDWYRTVGSELAMAAFLPMDPLFNRARRTTVAYAEGRFSFAGLPEGKYLVRATVTWEAATGDGAQGQGGVVAQLVTVVDAQRVDVVLRSAAVGGR